MTPAELRAALADLGLSQVGFARVARVDPRTVRKWVAGERVIPGPIVVLIELLRSRAIAGQADERGGSYMPGWGWPSSLFLTFSTQCAKTRTARQVVRRAASDDDERS